MPDDLTNRGPQDQSRISLLEPHEVQYWADKFNVSKERLSEAVKNVGHSAAAVEREQRLGGHHQDTCREDRGPIKSLADRADRCKRHRLQAIATPQCAEGSVAEDRHP